MRKGRLAAAFLLVFLVQASARAHLIRVSTLRIAVSETEVALDAPLLPIEILSDTPGALSAWQSQGRLDETTCEEVHSYFRERMWVTESGVRLPFHGETVEMARIDTGAAGIADGILRSDTQALDHLILYGRFARNPTRGPLEIDAGRLFVEMGEYPPIPIAEIRGPNYTAVHPFDGMDNWREPPPTETRWQRWLRAAAFVGTGMWHIFTGYDHMLFLLALHLVSPSFRETLKIVTAFTLSHSVTLALAATGTVQLSPRIVEPVVALTIVYVGIENLVFPHPAGRWKTAFFFGFIHGFGFAGALGQALRVEEMGRWAFALALLSFNVGVEIGQAVVVGALAPFWIGVRWVPRRHEIVVAGSIAISLAGVYWFFQRIL